MAQRLATLTLIIILLMSSLPALGQGGNPDGERPACTPEDVEPVSQLVIALINSLGQGTLNADDMLRWRTEIAALNIPACAGMGDALLQLHFAADELLIGALLLERVAAGIGDSTVTDTAALAINNGLSALVGMRFALRDTEAPAGGMRGAAPGELSGQAVLAAFEAAGLPIEAVAPTTAPDTPALREQIAFHLPGSPEGAGGQILIFADIPGRDAWLGELLTAEAEPGYLYLHRNVIVRLSPALDGETARRFRAALQAVE